MRLTQSAFLSRIYDCERKCRRKAWAAAATLCAAAGAVGVMPQIAHGQAYDESVLNRLYQQQTSYFCGPATAQVMLYSAGVAQTYPPTLADQQNLFNQIVAAQGGNYTGAPNADGTLPPGKTWANINTYGNFATSPYALQQVVQANDPNKSHVYINYNIGAAAGPTSGVNYANRILAYDVSHFNVAAGAMMATRPVPGPLIGGGHWVAVVGVNTTTPGAVPNAPPTATGNFTVNGFYVNDPWPPPPALPNPKRALYMATTGADNKWATLFLPTGYGGAPQGKYAFVADPDPTADDVDPVYPSAPANLASELTGAQADTYAANDIAAIAGLASDPAFEGGSFGTSGEMEDAADLALPQDEWLVPYDTSGELTGVALIDAATGVLDAAYYSTDGSPLDSGTISQLANEDESDSFFPTDNVPVPEPATLALLGTSAMGLLMRRRRKETR